MPEMTWLPNPPDGTRICLGFDGSESNDWTALKGETADGLLFTPMYGPDHRPTIWNPEEWGGKIPRGEVSAAVDEIFTRFEVKRFYADPQYWRSEIGDWSLEYGEECVFEWPTNSIQRMHPALMRFETDLATRRVRHDGCPLTALAAANAKKVSKPGQKYVLGKPTEHQKIDPVMAAVLAHEAAMDALAHGWEPKVEAKALVFGGRNRRRKRR